MTRPGQVAIQVAADMLERMLLDLGDEEGELRRALSPRFERACASVLAITRGDDAAERFDRLQAAKGSLDGLRFQLEAWPDTDVAWLARVDAVVAALDDYAQTLEPAALADSGEEGYSASLALPFLRESGAVVAPRLVSGEDDEELPELPSFDVDRLFEEALATERLPTTVDHFEARVAPERVELVQLKPPLAPGDITTPGPVGEEAQMRRIAKDCLEGLGTMGLGRRRWPDDPWAEGLARDDERMLAHVDALMALGEQVPGCRARLDVPAAILAYAEDEATSDPFRAFARAFALCCMEGEDKVRAAVVALRQSHESTHGAYVEAFALAPSPHVDPAMHRLCGEAPEDANLLVVALRAMHRRRSAEPEPVEPLVGHADARVRAWAVRNLAIAAPRRAGEAVERLLAHELEDDVILAALRARLLIDCARGREEISGLLDAERDAPGTLTRRARRGLLRLLGVAGQRDDLDRLLAEVPAWLEADRLDALGWFGHAAAIPTLLDALERREELAGVATLALHRLTGVVFGEEGDDDAYHAYRRPLDARAWRDRLVEQVVTAGERRRLGKPFALATCVSELSTIEVPQGIREQLAFELAVALGPQAASASHAWVDVRGWVAAQRAQCADLATRVAGLPEGHWLGQRGR